MKSRYICEIDLSASIEANIKFIDNCIEDLNKKKQRLKNLQKPKSKNQIDLEDSIKEITKDECLLMTRSTAIQILMAQIDQEPDHVLSDMLETFSKSYGRIYKIVDGKELSKLGSAHNVIRRISEFYYK